MSPIAAPQETLLCHCLRVREDQVREAVELGRCQTVRDIRRETGAGSGCTACHHKIRALLAAGRKACEAAEGVTV